VSRESAVELAMAADETDATEIEDEVRSMVCGDVRVDANAAEEVWFSESCVSRLIEESGVGSQRERMIVQGQSIMTSYNNHSGEMPSYGLRDPLI